MPVNLVESSVTNRELILSVVVEPATPSHVVEQRLLVQGVLLAWNSGSMLRDPLDVGDTTQADVGALT